MPQLKLSNGMIVLFDQEDYDLISKYKWYPSKGRNTYYAITTIRKDKKPICISMHRLITSCPKGLVVDHKDHNGLNNQRLNLRVCTKSDNDLNRLRYKNLSGPNERATPDFITDDAVLRQQYLDAQINFFERM